MRTLNVAKQESGEVLDTIALTKQEKQALGVFVERVRRSLGENLAGIILFGSKARGNAKKSSDIDLLVIVKKEDIKDAHKVYKAASRTDLRWGVDISPKMYSLDEYEREREMEAPFVKQIESEGVKLV
jgi:predicted nucleotidyltransferase